MSMFQIEQNWDKDSETAFEQKNESLNVWGVNSLSMPRTPYWASEGRHLKIHPHVIICTSFISSMDCTVFIVLHI